MLEEGPHLSTCMSLFFTKRQRTRCVKVRREDGGGSNEKAAPEVRVNS